MSAIALHLFKQDNSKLNIKVHTESELSGDIKGDPLFCIICHKLITSEGETIEVSGRHFHTCTNPANIIFDIRCFTHAPGCKAVGTATIEHTWFSGYRWQIVLCKECGEHLGWLFKNGGSFYGLIADRLTSDR